MPLEILLALVVFSIGGIVLILHALGLSKPRRLTTEAEARAAWDRENEDDPALEAHLSADGAAALIRRQTGSGLVWVMGADTTARALDAATWRPTKGALTFRFPDAGSSAARFDPGDTTLPDWLQQETP